MWGGSSDSEYRVRAFSRHSPRALLLREAEFSQGIQGIGARLLKNPKFVSWARIRARLGKSQVDHVPACGWTDDLQLGLYLYGCFNSRTLYIFIIYYISIFTDFSFRVICHFMSSI
jgi:hypothetical protein